MADEQNKKVEAPAGNAQNTPGGQNGGQGRRNRHRHHNHKKPNAGVQESAATQNRSNDGNNENNRNQNNQPNGGQKQNQNRQNGNGKQNQNPSAQQSANGNGNAQQKKGKNRHHGHGKNRGEGAYSAPQRMITDPYGIPSPQDQKILDELRAKIVLKAADGSIPAEAQKKPRETVQNETAPAHQTRLADSLVPQAPEATSVSKPAPEVADVNVENLPSEALFADPAACSGFASGEELVEVVGIRFRASGKVYFFDPNGMKMKFGDHAIVETARGIEFGDVTGANRMLPKSETVSPLRPVIRIATKEDVTQNEQNRKDEESALLSCQKKIEEHKLDMHLVDAQYAFDRTKLIFYFTSENRVDFRELVRDLAGIFHTRIDLRQIGIRDEAKMLGGLGACGRPLCCSAFLSDFVQVTIKMAKEQGLSLNSSKISGACGRLMCCLRYESDVYAEEIRLTPSVDSVVRTPEGTGKVIATNPLAGSIRVLIADGQDTVQKVFAREEVVVLEKGKKNSEEKKDSDTQNS